MHRRPIVVANWKMHTSLTEAHLLARRLSHAVEKHDDVDMVILPPVIWLPSLVTDLHHRPKSLHFGVQNFYPRDEGAFTGEVGTSMLKGLAQYVLIGHSERRTLFNESDELINEKVHAALRAGLSPILCVGELTKVMLETRGRGRPTLTQKQSDLFRQLDSALAGIHERHIERLILCYEPLWAIGSGHNVPGSHVQAVIEQLRSRLVSRYGQQTAARIRTLYGGSVTEQTITEYIYQPDIDGVLVGGASLQVKHFLPIVEAVALRTHHTVQHREHQ